MSSSAIKIFQDRFGRIALFDMTASLVGHANHQCHILVKVGGVDSAFCVRGQRIALTETQAVLANAWAHPADEHQSPEQTAGDNAQSTDWRCMKNGDKTERDFDGPLCADLPTRRRA